MQALEADPTNVGWRARCSSVLFFFQKSVQALLRKARARSSVSWDLCVASFATSLDLFVKRKNYIYRMLGLRFVASYMCILYIGPWNQKASLLLALCFPVLYLYFPEGF